MRKHLFDYVLLAFLILLSQQIHAQSVLVTGKVVDTEGNPLPGVSIRNIGKTTNATSTSIDGKFALSNLNSKDSILFTYVGYENQTRLIGDQTVINIILKETSKELAEFQVVAFQKQKRKVS